MTEPSRIVRILDREYSIVWREGRLVDDWQLHEIDPDRALAIIAMRGRSRAAGLDA